MLGYSDEDLDAATSRESKAAADAEKEAAASKALLDQLKNGTLNVKVVNPPPAPPPRAASPSTDTSTGEPSDN